MRASYYLLLLSFFCTTLVAQESDTWPKPGAVWKFCMQGDYPLFTVWSHTYAYTTDTVIGAHNYAMVQHSEVNNEPLAADGSSWWVPEEDMRVYFRQSGDTIYRYANGQDYVFFVQNIEVDQSFTSFRSLNLEWQSWNCTDELPLKVISDDETEYSGVTFREWVLQDMDPYFNESFSFENTYTFIEGVGLNRDVIYLTPEHVVNTHNESGDLSECLGGVSHLGISQLYHYHDNEMNIDLSTCNFTVSIDESDFSTSVLLLFPNPAKDKVNVQLNGDYNGQIHVRVFDPRGIICHEQLQFTSETPLDINGLTPGLYLVVAETDHRVFTQKLVIE